MDVWRITVAALRRWYGLLPLLIVTGVAVIAAGNGVAPEYEARASAMIMPERAEGRVPNPYGGIDAANSAVGIVLNSIESHQSIQERGLAATYEVGTQPRSAIFQISIRADSPEVAEQAGVAVIELARQELATRQTDAGLPEAAQYSLSVLEPPAVISVVQTGKSRVQAVVGVLGAGLSLLVAVLFDDIVGLIRRFRAKRADRPDDRADDVEPPVEPHVPTVPAGLAPSHAEVDDAAPPVDQDDEPREPSPPPRRRRSNYEVVRRS